MADGVTQGARQGGWLGRSCLLALALLVVIAGAGVAGFWGISRYISDRISPNPETIATASLQGLREQNRLSTFAARYVAVVTSKQSRLGLTAQKTLIMPGMVRYEVDLAKLNQRDMRWDADAKKLRVQLPPIEVVGPQIDLNQIREYGEGGLLMSLSDAEAKLDAANRAAGQRELVRQAREATPMNLAKNATRRAIERSFAMPLRAAGVEASVEVTFPDERNATGTERWDTTRTPAQVLEGR